MKKILIYTVIFIGGIIVGYYFTQIRYTNFESVKKQRISAVEGGDIDRYYEDELFKLTPSLLGKSLRVKGTLEDVFKNKDNEMVLHIKDSSKPIVINCTLSKSDVHLKSPLKLGQIVNIEGLLCQNDGAIFLKSCKLLNNSISVN